MEAASIASEASHMLLKHDESIFSSILVFLRKVQ